MSLIIRPFRLSLLLITILIHNCNGLKQCPRKLVSGNFWTVIANALILPSRYLISPPQLPIQHESTRHCSVEGYALASCTLVHNG